MNGLDLTLFELTVLVKVSETQSLREAARELDLNPAHISKALKRIETKTGLILFKSSSKGMLFTPRGTTFYKQAKKLIEQSKLLMSDDESDVQVNETVIGIASISFINTHLLPACILKLNSSLPSTRFRLLDVATSSMVKNGIQGAFEMCLHLGPFNWPKSWTSIKVGKLTSSLYARANHPLLPIATEEEILHFPFVIPTYWTGTDFTVGEDHCPLPVSKRKHGHEASTAVSALAIVQISEQVGFLPDILAESLVQSGVIGKVNVEHWKEIGDDVYLSVDSSKIKQTLLNSLIKEIQKKL